MRYSANLNIMVKALEKATVGISRDFSELENLQNNPTSAIKFTNACYKRVKEILIDDLSKFRPDYNLIFTDSEKILRNNAEYSFTIYPIDSLTSLVRGLPEFTVAIALEHIDKDNNASAVAVAINKVVGSELYYCEKGFGAYLNNRRIRVSKRSISDAPLISLDDQNILSNEIKEALKLKNYALRQYGCSTLELAYMAASKFDLAFFKLDNYKYLKPFTLIVKEAGGRVIENDKFILASNNLINI